MQFPVNGLDLTSYVLSTKFSDKINYTYDLFAVSNHYGGISGGHYTAYGFNTLLNKWYDFNDSSVRSTDRDGVVSEAAYLLFYRRRDSEKCKMETIK